MVDTKIRLNKKRNKIYSFRDPNIIDHVILGYIRIFCKYIYKKGHIDTISIV